jgi:hypothetical protein
MFKKGEKLMSKDFKKAPAAAAFISQDSIDNAFDSKKTENVATSQTASAIPTKKTKNLNIALSTEAMDYLRLVCMASDTSITSYINKLVQNDMKSSKLDVAAAKNIIASFKK